ncbi:MAG: hypothetical protein PF690_05410 [Deltaproteobacteria bacterium]|jgi:hypothetical protein|nr:hypothetical protein [Deltaproteobacteria bacterium]
MYLKTVNQTKDLTFLEVGKLVRLKLNTGSCLWAKVDSARDNGTFRGVAVDTFDPVNKGDLVIFNHDHVFSIRPVLFGG